MYLKTKGNIIMTKIHNYAVCFKKPYDDFYSLNFLMQENSRLLCLGNLTD